MAQDPALAQPENEELTKSAQIRATREEWNQLKKAFNDIMPLAHQVASLKEIGNKPNKLKNEIKKMKKKVKVYETKLHKLTNEGEEGRTEGEEWITLFRNDSDLTQQTLSSKLLDVRRYTQSITKTMEKLLAEYKKAKAEEDPEYGKPQQGDEDQ